MSIKQEGKKVVGKKTGRQKVRANPAGPHPFVTHFIEPLRRDNSPEEAVRKLKLCKLEWLRASGNDSTSDPIYEQEYGGERKIKIILSEALELVDMYINYYEEEAKLTSVNNSSHETANNEPKRLDWAGTFRQFKVLLDKLADRKYIKKPGPYQYAYIFADHFCIDGHPVSERTILREIEGKDDHPRQQTSSDATRIDWLRAYTRYRYLIDKLSEAGFIAPSQKERYPSIFAEHFKKDGKIVPAHKVSDNGRNKNYCYTADETLDELIASLKEKA